MDHKSFQMLPLVGGLRRALERQEFVVHYQPQASVHTGRIIGMEAFVRWQHPQWGLIRPGWFIPAAEEAGLIVPIDEWVMRATCAQGRAWQEAGIPPLRMTVHLSARRFLQSDLVRNVALTLMETHLDPHCLELEIPEAATMRDGEYTKRVLSDLREMGVRISIGDFGTGYSALASLKRFPVHSLKIDRYFVGDICLHRNSGTIAAAIIGIAHSLHMKAVAEGVETQNQLDFLAERGCDMYQGNLLAEPMPAAEIEARLLRSDGVKLAPVLLREDNLGHYVLSFFLRRPQP